MAELEKCYWCNDRARYGSANFKKFSFVFWRPEEKMKYNVIPIRYACRTHLDHLKLWAGLEQFQRS